MHELDEMMSKDNWWRGFKYGVFVGMVAAFIIVGVSG